MESRRPNIYAKYHLEQWNACPNKNPISTRPVAKNNQILEESEKKAVHITGKAMHAEPKYDPNMTFAIEIPMLSNKNGKAIHSSEIGLSFKWIIKLSAPAIVNQLHNKLGPNSTKELSRVFACLYKIDEAHAHAHADNKT
tara:strand:- start:3144 stop:3563 length:420 start_codon:yes stop_codon:yes gene_type:complete